MREQLKQRLVGATVLVALGVILIPEFLEPPEEPVASPESKSQDAAGDLVSEIVVVDQSASAPAPKPVAPPPAAAPLAPGSPDVAPAVTENSTAVVDSKVSVAASPEVARPTAPPGTAWVVQLATFSEKRNASDLLGKVRDMGYPVFLQSQPAQKGTLTMVFVGPLRAKYEAEKALARLEGEFKLKGMVLQRKAE